MNMQMEVHIGLLYFVKKMKLLIAIILVLNVFLTKFKEFIRNKNIKTNIFRLQEDISIMCGHFYIGFIDFMLAGKKLIDYTNLFCPYDFKKNDSIILSYFKNE